MGNVNAHKLGPGHLAFGASGTQKEFGVALTSAKLVPEAKDGEIIEVLSGDQLVEDSEETWTLEGSLYQSYDAESLVLWCHQNSGDTLPFTFTPSNEGVLEATGSVLIRSITLGGDVKVRNKSDFKFQATGVVIDATTP